MDVIYLWFLWTWKYWISVCSSNCTSQNDCKKNLFSSWKAFLYHRAASVASDKSESKYFRSPGSACLTPPWLDVYSLPPSSWSSIAFHNGFWPWSFSVFFFPGERSEVSSLYFRHFPPIISLNTFFFHCSFWIPIILTGGSFLLPMSILNTTDTWRSLLILFCFM